MNRSFSTPPHGERPHGSFGCGSGNKKGVQFFSRPLVEAARALIAKGGIFWCRLQSEGCEVGRGEVHGNRRANESIAEEFSGLICEGHRTGANGLRGGPAGRSRVWFQGRIEERGASVKRV